MLDYRLYYWDLPFRGNFIQLFLEEVGARYELHDAGELYPERRLKIRNPGMAPPYLYECRSKTYYAQMPAILMHLAAKYDYLPKSAEIQTMALKIILDCNDLLMEITNFYGMVMWGRKRWVQFRHTRLQDWMKIFEKTGLKHGLADDRGFMLGSSISVADIAVAALFGTLTHSFPTLEMDLRKNAPCVASLCRRIEARPAIRQFLRAQRNKIGKSYCGGQIEESLRKMLD